MEDKIVKEYKETLGKEKKKRDKWVKLHRMVEIVSFELLDG